MTRIAAAAVLALCALLDGARAAPPGQTLARQRVVDKAAAWLFASQGGGLEARALDEGQGDLSLPGGAPTLHARLPAGTLLARRMVVNVDIEVDGRHWRTIPVWFAVQAWRPVWVARAPMAAGQPIGSEQFVVERREVAALASPALPGGQPLEGLQLRGALATGAVLTAAAIEARHAVARNQPVQVRVSAGHVELLTSGVALADARIGEPVRVLNPTSRQTYAARVVADGLVVAGER